MNKLEGIVHWIKKQLEPLFGPLSSDDISRFLCMHHVQKLDIPFIAMYLKEDCLTLLKDHPEQPEEEKSKVKWYRILWAAQELHKKWLLFQNQKRALRFSYNKRFEEESRLGLIHDKAAPQLFESIINSLQAAESQREVEDINSKFNLHFPATEGPATIVICSDPGVSRAKDSLLTEYGRALFNKVSVAPPYQRNETAPPRVMACCWGPGDPATTLVMLDSCGEILDVLCTGPLSWESLTWTIPFFDEATQQRMNCDQERILKFVTDHQPDVTIIGAANMSCPLLREQLLWVSDTMMMKPNSRASPLRIVYGDESLARLYEISEISSEQLPGRSGIARRAVALGRYLQNPLAMVATLCGAGREILSWKLLNSPDENYLNPDEKYAVIEQVMIDVTNQVGLDINLAINHEWLFAPLQFISGLGPQKQHL
ncbi:putative ribonuclease H-like domain, transcription elongation factor Spt6 [Rosa chinensis]|uniref:Putative ribonuclease H-like domain, transcription elongation factor Spt6 n=1 Tax=Rosa chinensis TaxID=74649 RepID=A0A2P6RIR1_ROSCH|nr:putative ribonuclease H-like domain, transcription elongation factor Spt6 [Rosa chinensis]